MDTDTESVAEKVKEERYFQEARDFYGLIYHTPMAERSYFIVIILSSLFTTWLSFGAFFTVMGDLAPSIPFVAISADGWEERPSIRKLAVRGEEKNAAVRRYLVGNYVSRREYYMYDAQVIERNYNNVESQSSPEVTKEYSAWMNAQNTNSPFNLYANHTKRDVVISQVEWLPYEDGQYHCRVHFKEVLEGRRVSTTPEWFADIAFTYTDYEVKQDVEDLSMFNFFSIALDVYFDPEKYYNDKKFEVTPMTFKVTSYVSKPKLVDR